ncbi:hypothetical protein Ccrd_026081, partial [Cynara cardunculus var. scolymus]
FDALDFDKKNIFLDIACSFIGEDKDFAASVLGSSAHANIQVLVDKSLITISRDNNLLQMHDLIQSMARRIIHEEFVVKEVWSRLWNLSELRNVLSKNKAIEGLEVLDLSLKQSSPNFHIDGEAFEDMKNLRILKISYGELENFWEDSKVNYSGRLKALSNELTLLYWNGCPFEFPLDFYPENIVVIDLSYSYLKTLWTTPKVCMSQPLPDHNPSITTQISSLLQFMELPSNTCGIFGGQERQFFQGDLLEIIYHGNRIPQWFTNTKMGNHIHVELPPNFCYNKFRGYGICVIFTQKRSYGRHNYNNAPRLVFDEDIEETTNFSLTQDLPTPTEEGGAIQMWRNNR